ncbi:MAG TPA: class I SAM-dependent methyltransferase [Nitrolancea sp.]
MNRHTPDIFAGTAAYYARFRPGYPAEFLMHVIERFGLDGQGRLLDLGCGTGQLALPLAPYVAEAVGLDPDPMMLAEAAASAARAGIRNVRWLRGSDSDLDRLSHEIGPLRLALMGRSFHWMEQEALLRSLDKLIEPGGGVVVVSDEERVWAGQETWHETIRQAIHRWLGPQRRAGSGNYEVEHVPFDETFSASPFPRVEHYHLTVERAPTIDEIVGYLYSTSFCSPAVLGDKQAAFEADLRQQLSAYDHLTESIEFGAWLAWRA